MLRNLAIELWTISFDSPTKYQIHFRAIKIKKKKEVTFNFWREKTALLKIFKCKIHPKFENLYLDIFLQRCAFRYFFFFFLGNRDLCWTQIDHVDSLRWWRNKQQSEKKKKYIVAATSKPNSKTIQRARRRWKKQCRWLYIRLLAEKRKFSESKQIESWQMEQRSFERTMQRKSWQSSAKIRFPSKDSK